MEKVLTDNAGELIKIRWDGVRFALTQEKGDGWYEAKKSSVIILNPREMMSLISFAGALGEEGD